ncbi:hypothetical protein F5Y10DRAFT_252441 [Nemania abortiva]|nr:hypothetical protein F5Y10DRAFT_252441 [Nemania abortiva]
MTTAAKPETGDKVSWKWGGGAPGGTVAETKDKGEIAIKSKRGNTIKKNASPDNPAVHVKRSGNDVVKRASELTVEKKGSSNGKNGSKRKADSQENEDEDEGENEGEEDSDAAEDPHTINKEGKEVKRGGKDANKKQKTRPGGDVKDKTDGSETSEEEEDDEEQEMESEEEEEDEDEDEVEDGDEAEKSKQTNGDKKSASSEKAQADEKNGEKSNDESDAEEKDPAPGNDGDSDDDIVSARTRSHDKAD